MWVCMAEIFDVLKNSVRARELRMKAASLFERFNEVFWDDGMEFYVYALDGATKAAEVPRS